MPAPLLLPTYSSSYYYYYYYFQSIETMVNHLIEEGGREGGRKQTQDTSSYLVVW